MMAMPPSLSSNAGSGVGVAAGAAIVGVAGNGVALCGTVGVGEVAAPPQAAASNVTRDAMPSSSLDMNGTARRDAVRGARGGAMWLEHGHRSVRADGVTAQCNEGVG